MKQLTPALTYVGVHDPDLRVFDIIMRTEYGTTYNAYLLRGEKKSALFETVKAGFADEFFQSLEGVIDPATVDYLIVNHTEPDHAGSVERLLTLNPNLTIVATQTAIGFLRAIVNRDFNALPVKEGDALDLGGQTLRFFPLPNLHWPDTMFTYIEEEKALVTCDAFGAHYAHAGILRSNVPDEAAYLACGKYYFDNILGPFRRPFLQKALDKIEGLPLDWILTGHGPVLDSHIPEWVQTYRDWCRAPEQGKKTIVMPYVSAYGYTRALAEAIAEGAALGGAVSVHLYDMLLADADEVMADIAAADGLLFGTPTMLGEALEPIWALLGRMMPLVHAGKRASAFGDYGWSGEGVPHVIERLKQIRLKVADEGFKVRLKPTEADLEGARAFGRAFGESL
jgi:flavorubredoxin